MEQEQRPPAGLSTVERQHRLAAAEEAGFQRDWQPDHVQELQSLPLERGDPDIGGALPLRSSGLSKAYLHKLLAQASFSKSLPSRRPNGKGDQLQQQQEAAQSEYQTRYQAAPASPRARVAEHTTTAGAGAAATALSQSLPRRLHHSINTLGLGTRLPENEADLLPVYPPREWQVSEGARHAAPARWKDRVGEFMWSDSAEQPEASTAAPQASARVTQASAQPRHARVDAHRPVLRKHPPREHKHVHFADEVNGTRGGGSAETEPSAPQPVFVKPEQVPPRLPPGTRGLKHSEYEDQYAWHGPAGERSQYGLSLHHPDQLLQGKSMRDIFPAAPPAQSRQQLPREPRDAISEYDLAYGWPGGRPTAPPPLMEPRDVQLTPQNTSSGVYEALHRAKDSLDDTEYADRFMWRGPLAFPHPPMPRITSVGTSVDEKDIDRVAQAEKQQYRPISEYRRRFEPPPEPTSVSVGTEVTERDLLPPPSLRPPPKPESEYHLRYQWPKSMAPSPSAAQRVSVSPRRVLFARPHVAWRDDRDKADESTQTPSKAESGGGQREETPPPSPHVHPHTPAINPVPPGERDRLLHLPGANSKLVPFLIMPQDKDSPHVPRAYEDHIVLQDASGNGRPWTSEYDRMFRDWWHSEDRAPRAPDRPCYETSYQAAYGEQHPLITALRRPHAPHTPLQARSASTTRVGRAPTGEAGQRAGGRDSSHRDMDAVTAQEQYEHDRRVAQYLRKHQLDGSNVVNYFEDVGREQERAEMERTATQQAQQAQHKREQAQRHQPSSSSVPTATAAAAKAKAKAMHERSPPPERVPARQTMAMSTPSRPAATHNRSDRVGRQSSSARNRRDERPFVTAVPAQSHNNTAAHAPLRAARGDKRSSQRADTAAARSAVGMTQQPSSHMPTSATAATTTASGSSSSAVSASSSSSSLVSDTEGSSRFRRRLPPADFQPQQLGSTSPGRYTRAADSRSRAGATAGAEGTWGGTTSYHTYDARRVPADEWVPLSVEEGEQGATTNDPTFHTLPGSACDRSSMNVSRATYDLAQATLRRAKRQLHSLYGK